MLEGLSSTFEPGSGGAALRLLLDLTLKGVVVLALAGLLAALLRRASAAVRHWIWFVAMGSLLCLPVLTLMLPSWHVSLLPLPSFAQTVQPSRPFSSPALAPSPAALPAPASPPAPVARPRASLPSLAPSPPSAPSPPKAEAPSPAVRPDMPVRVREETVLATPSDEAGAGVFARVTAPVRNPGGRSWAVWALVVWALGAMLVPARLLAGSVCLRRVARHAEPGADAGWRALVDEIAGRLRVARPVRLMRSRHTTMPMTWGIVRPVILLPAGAEDWSEERRRCVLLHEMAHIKRWDCLTQSLAQIACAVQWFNPLVWAAARRLRVEREKACDDLVLRFGARPSHYAMHLLEAARAFRAPRLLPVGAVSMARPSQLESRVRAILDSSLRRRDVGPRAALGTLALALLVMMPLAAFTPWATAPPDEARAEAPDAVRRTPAVVAPDLEPVHAHPATPAPPDTTEREKTVKRLMAALDDADPSVRRRAAYGLGERRIEAAVPSLAEALTSDPSPRMRRVTAWALGEIGDAGATKSLTRALAYDPEPSVRAKAAWALGEIGDACTADALRRALDDAAPAVRRRAAYALGEIGEKTRWTAARDSVTPGFDRDSREGRSGRIRRGVQASAARGWRDERRGRNPARATRADARAGNGTLFDEAFGENLEAVFDEAFGENLEAAFDEAFGENLEAVFDEAFGEDLEAVFDEAFGENLEAVFDEAFEDAFKETFEDDGLTDAIHSLSARISGMQTDLDGAFIDELTAIIEEDPKSREAGRAVRILKGIDDPRARRALESLYQ
ncbi:M56 family metallopeptidase [Rhodocaloribacter sp.]